MLTDEALFDRLLGGDMGAFDELYDRHERPLFAFALRLLRDRAEAEDVLHEAFMAVLREGDSGLRPESFRALIYTVTRNLCHNRHRSRRRAESALGAVAREPAPAAPLPEQALLDGEAAAALTRAVAGLPEGLAEVYHLRASGLSYEELSQVLSVPLGTIKSRMHEVVRRLREEMA